MKNDLKIYFEDLVLHIVPLSGLLSSDENKKVYEGFKLMPTRLFNHLQAHKGSGMDIFVASADPYQYFKLFAAEFKLMHAAGGLVLNSENKFLFIFRNGKWDLPKGKIEENENPEMAACREVSEECGIGFPEIVKFICNTYHIYELNGKYILKETNWFLMNYSGDENPVPQREEGITKAEWTDGILIDEYLKNSYGTIRDVFENQKDKI